MMREEQIANLEQRIAGITDALPRVDAPEYHVLHAQRIVLRRELRILVEGK